MGKVGPEELEHLPGRWRSGSFESLMLAVIEQPEWARELLAKLTDEIEPALSD
jgi:hypothetical protein